jgi:hypothetical protein
MVVRAVCDIPAGEELTVSYLGREELSPAQVRQKLLHDRCVPQSFCICASTC